MHACQAGVHGLGMLFSRKKQIPPLTALLNLNADLGNDVMSMALSNLVSASFLFTFFILSSQMLIEGRQI